MTLEITFSKRFRVFFTFLSSFITMSVYSRCSLGVSALFLISFLNLTLLSKFISRVLSSFIVLALMIAGFHLPILPKGLVTIFFVFLMSAFLLGPRFKLLNAVAALKLFVFSGFARSFVTLLPLIRPAPLFWALFKFCVSTNSAIFAFVRPLIFLSLDSISLRVFALMRPRIALRFVPGLFNWAMYFFFMFSDKDVERT